MFISEMFLDARRIKFMFLTTFVWVPHRKTDIVFIINFTQEPVPKLEHQTFETSKSILSFPHKIRK